MTQYQSWGHYPTCQHTVKFISHRHQAIPRNDVDSVLPFGNGRSYGDVCLNDGNSIVSTKMLDQFLLLDSEQGVLRCESGVHLNDVLKVIIPRGYFIPVTPGTQFVTIGGMLANDVHGKNHHRAGTIGRFVRAFELLRTDGTRLLCSPEKNKEYFQMTIGGLGLTGLITWVELSLIPIHSAFMYQETRRFNSLKEFFELSDESDSQWDYTVAWIDAFGKGAESGRGVFFRGNHMTDGDFALKKRKLSLNVPFNLPSLAMQSAVIKTFNRLYYLKNKDAAERLSYDQFFYPLDRIANWNRLYGKNGFFQYQCVIPVEHANDIITEMLGLCLKYNAGSFLSVLKKFGSLQSPGFMSFPREGYTLALDFPNHGNKTLKLLETFDRLVVESGGAVYPAKDARMSGAVFRRYFPQWESFSDYIDPGCSSSFWRRVTGDV